MLFNSLSFSLSLYVCVCVGLGVCVRFPSWSGMRFFFSFSQCHTLDLAPTVSTTIRCCDNLKSSRAAFCPFSTKDPVTSVHFTDCKPSTLSHIFLSVFLNPIFILAWRPKSQQQGRGEGKKRKQRSVCSGQWWYFSSLLPGFKNALWIHLHSARRMTPAFSLVNGCC